MLAAVGHNGMSSRIYIDDNDGNAREMGLLVSINYDCVCDVCVHFAIIRLMAKRVECNTVAMQACRVWTVETWLEVLWLRRRTFGWPNEDINGNYWSLFARCGQTSRYWAGQIPQQVGKDEEVSGGFGGRWMLILWRLCEGLAGNQTQTIDDWVCDYEQLGWQLMRYWSISMNLLGVDVSGYCAGEELTAHTHENWMRNAW